MNLHDVGVEPRKKCKKQRRGDRPSVATTLEGKCDVTTSIESLSGKNKKNWKRNKAQREYSFNTLC